MRQGLELKHRLDITTELIEIAELIDLARADSTTESQTNLLLNMMDLKVQNLISQFPD